MTIQLMILETFFKMMKIWKAVKQVKLWTKVQLIKLERIMSKVALKRIKIQNNGQEDSQEDVLEKNGLEVYGLEEGPDHHLEDCIRESFVQVFVALFLLVNELMKKEDESHQKNFKISINKLCNYF